jgi:flagellar FliL protein
MSLDTGGARAAAPPGRALGGRQARDAHRPLRRAIVARPSSGVMGLTLGSPPTDADARFRGPTTPMANGTRLAWCQPRRNAMSEEAESAAAAPAKGGNKILPIILVFNTLLLTGVLIFVMKRPSAQAAGDHGAKAEHGEGAAEGGEHGEKGEGPGEKGEGPGPTLRLENFIVQVRTTEGDRYAHLTIELEINSEADKPAFEGRMARIRDGIIGFVSDRSEDELRGSEGLAQLKDALAKKLDEIVPGHKVRALYITEFIIQ